MIRIPDFRPTYRVRLHAWSQRTTIIMLTLIAAIITGLASAQLLPAVERLGRNIRSDGMAADYVFGVIWFLILAFALFVFPFPKRHRAAVLAVWAAKGFVALGVMLPFEDAYSTLDAFNWFAESAKPGFDWGRLGVGTGDEYVIATMVVLRNVLPDSYHAFKVTFALIGLIGIYLAYRAIVMASGRDDRRIFLGLALFPSILFWSSILGKDPLTLFAIAIYMYGVVAWYRTAEMKHVSIAAVGVLLATLIRAWLGVILVLPLAILVLDRSRSTGARVILVASLAAGIVLSLTVLAGRFDIRSPDDLIETTSTLSRAWIVGGSAQDIDQLGLDLRTVPGLVAFAPIGAFTALFRPLPGEVPNLFGFLSGLENMLLLGLLLRSLRPSALRRVAHPLVLSATTLLILWAAIYGYVSYQNLGTAVRFKLQVLPIMLALLVYLPSRLSLPRGARPGT